MLFRSAKKDFSDKIEPVAYDKDGNKIDSTNLTFKNNGSRVTDITVNVTVYNTKTIPIELEVIGEPAEGYVFTDQLESSPDAIVVGGVTKRLAKMTTLKIPVDITGASNEYETNISLDEYLPDGIKLVNSDVKLSVRVMLERVITKSIDLTKADIEMRNLQSGYKAVYIDETDEITIQLQGTQSQLKDFTSKSIGAYIDLSSAKEGEYYFQLQFDNISEKFLVQAVQLVHLSVKDGVTKPESTPNATPSPMPDNEAEQTSPPLID